MSIKQIAETRAALRRALSRIPFPVEEDEHEGDEFSDRTEYGHRTLVGHTISPRAPAPPRQRTPRRALKPMPRIDIPEEWGVPFCTITLSPTECDNE